MELGDLELGAWNLEPGIWDLVAGNLVTFVVMRVKGVLILMNRMEFQGFSSQSH